MIIIPEHDALAAIAEGLRKAEEGARIMAIHRPEVSFMWEKMAEAFGVNRHAVMKLAQERASKTMAEKGPIRHDRH